MADAASSPAECDQGDVRGDNSTAALIAMDGSEQSFYALDCKLYGIMSVSSKFSSLVNYLAS